VPASPHESFEAAGTPSPPTRFPQLGHRSAPLLGTFPYRAIPSDPLNPIGYGEPEYPVFPEIRHPPRSLGESVKIDF